MSGNSNDGTNFSHKLLLTNIKFSKNLKSLENGSSANIKFTATQLSKIVQFGRFLFGSPGILYLVHPDITWSNLPMPAVKGLS